MYRTVMPFQVKEIKETPSNWSATISCICNIMLLLFHFD